MEKILDVVYKSFLILGFGGAGSLFILDSVKQFILSPELPCWRVIGLSYIFTTGLLIWIVIIFVVRYYLSKECKDFQKEE